MLSFDSQSEHFLVDGAPATFSPEEISEMNSYEWWHSIPFSREVRPKGYCQPTDFISRYMLDSIDFRGKSVLDIGCWDGFQLFYAEARGASRVVGVDKLDQRHMGAGARSFAKRKLRSSAEFIDMNVYELSPEKIGTFDIVMMFGVLYHLVHPMLGIERACSVCKNEFLLATHFLPSTDPMPWCVLYAGAELDHDASNWSGPNRIWILKALEMQGFGSRRENIYHPDRIAVYGVREGNAFTRDPILNSFRDTSLLIDKSNQETKSR